jgi:hypothetical protein
MPTPTEAVPLNDAGTRSTAEAIALLDAQFPWLQCAEKRTSWKREIPGVHTQNGQPISRRRLLSPGANIRSRLESLAV